MMMMSDTSTDDTPGTIHQGGQATGSVAAGSKGAVVEAHHGVAPWLRSKGLSSEAKEKVVEKLARPPAAMLR